MKPFRRPINLDEMLYGVTDDLCRPFPLSVAVLYLVTALMASSTLAEPVDEERNDSPPCPEMVR